MMKRIVVDPVTRIEGHLRIEAVVENGVITEAYSAGMMVRGLELILKGRDPRDAWAFTQRACGVCTTTHALTSVRCVEDALGIVVPENAELIRNIMNTALYVQDHVVHFYHLHALDWVDVVSALSADPKETSRIAQSISRWPKSSPKYFADVQNRLRRFVESGQLGIFANGYWGHKQFKLPPEINLLAVTHYLEALEWQKELVKIHAIFGGKNPHPNYLVGGVPCSLNLNEVNAINSERLNHVGSLIKAAIEFVEQVYIPDLLAIAGYYKDWGAIGGGLPNYLSYGEFPTKGYNNPEYFKFPRGAILDRNLSEVHEVNGRDQEEIREYIKHSWYSYGAGDDASLHPWEGETEFNYTGPKPPFEQLDVDGKYSWVKTPRWKDHAMEVGPLSRMLVAYASGNTEVQDVVNDTLGKLQVPVTALFSTLGRTAARGLETLLIVHWMKDYFDHLVQNVRTGLTSTFTQEGWEPSTWPDSAQGLGLTEAPRGALAHYIRIENQKIANYQLVVPTTWNASPRDPSGQRSSYEAALIGTPVADEEQPLEIIRTIHSFDPCLACAVHLYDPEGKHIQAFQIG
ncbi:MAG: nickel-dependent hydrogenase large subunit [Acidobacteria bacterium]|uniref:Nickel-dependent hydrogenase large subunit n=1 Tax=Candidatus Polarisedimenticola svalbardensis TaxID=2886004 RepID=A0A8J7CD93_9BACT|nr:nickel-dependent hydrogenase large subunit [Candidatus Polarisedimenticola svalbardensis]